jgi:hypothetical protein
VVGFLFAVVVLVAAGTWVARRLRARAARLRVRHGPGTSLTSAIGVHSFDEIDRTVAARRCHCESRLRTVGEGTREVGERRYRFARLVCDDCEENFVLYFDVSEVRH